MDSILQTLLSWQFIIFGLAIAAIIFVLRKIVEFFLFKNPSVMWSKIWLDLILPILPVIIGPFIGYVLKSYPYPEGLVSTGNRIIFGLVAGLLSTLLYRVIKALLVQKVQAAAGAIGIGTSTVSTPLEVIPETQMSSRGKV